MKHIIEPAADDPIHVVVAVFFTIYLKKFNFKFKLNNLRSKGRNLQHLNVPRPRFIACTVIMHSIDIWRDNKDIYNNNYYGYYNRFTCSQFKVPEHVSSTQQSKKLYIIAKRIESYTSVFEFNNVIMFYLRTPFIHNFISLEYPTGIFQQITESQNGDHGIQRWSKYCDFFWLENYRIKEGCIFKIIIVFDRNVWKRLWKLF